LKNIGRAAGERAVVVVVAKVVLVAEQRPSGAVKHWKDREGAEEGEVRRLKPHQRSATEEI
jgi:hypothetical protein